MRNDCWGMKTLDRFDGTAMKRGRMKVGCRDGLNRMNAFSVVAGD